MATNYQQIIDSIDEAIADWVGRPVQLTINGRTVQYRSLDELIRTRNHYRKLIVQSSGKRGFKISGFRPGGAR